MSHGLALHETCLSREALRLLIRLQDRLVRANLAPPRCRSRTGGRTVVTVGDTAGAGGYAPCGRCSMAWLAGCNEIPDPRATLSRGAARRLLSRALSRVRPRPALPPTGGKDPASERRGRSLSQVRRRDRRRAALPVREVLLRVLPPLRGKPRRTLLSEVRRLPADRAQGEPVSAPRPAVRGFTVGDGACREASRRARPPPASGLTLGHVTLSVWASDTDARGSASKRAHSAELWLARPLLGCRAA
jgi:hypothetical protein